MFDSLSDALRGRVELVVRSRRKAEYGVEEEMKGELTIEGVVVRRVGGMLVEVSGWARWWWKGDWEKGSWELRKGRDVDSRLSCIQGDLSCYIPVGFRRSILGSESNSLEGQRQRKSERIARSILLRLRDSVRKAGGGGRFRFTYGGGRGGVLCAMAHSIGRHRFGSGFAL